MLVFLFFGSALMVASVCAGIYYLQIMTKNDIIHDDPVKEVAKEEKTSI